MATPILSNLNVELSYKIFDPVSSSTTNGQIFSSSLRTSYLSRAYNKLARVLEQIYQDVSHIFPAYYITIDLSSYIDGQTEIPDYYDILNIYYRSNAKSSLKRMRYIPPTTYYNVKAGIDSFYTPSIAERYWTIIEGKLKVLPNETSLYNTVEGVVKNKVRTLVLDGSSDIDISSNYFDLLLTLAAMEASADNAEWQAYNVYRQTFLDDVRLMAQAEVIRKREGSNDIN